MSLKPQKVVTGILGLAIDREKRFLITQRNQPQHPEVHGKWQVPGGGLEFGEQPAETLVREFEEELKIIPTILHPQPICHTQVWHHFDYSTSATLLCYIVTIGDQTPAIGDPETLAFKWVHQDDLAALEYLPLTKTFIDEAHQICTVNNLWS
jgi:8-oxo-dGTP diphosphatase